MTNELSSGGANIQGTPAAPALGTYWTEQRQELHAWMRRRAGPLADLYAGGLELLFGPSIPAKPRFVAHAVREIVNRLPDVLVGKTQGRLDTTNRLDALARVWNSSLPGGSTPAAMLQADIQSDESPQVVAIPIRLHREIEKLMRDWAASRVKAPERMKQLFLALAPELKSSPEVIEPVLIQWAQTTKYFMGLVHENLNESAYMDTDELVLQFELFERSLANLVGSFYKGLDVLDEILDQANI